LWDQQSVRRFNYDLEMLEYLIKLYIRYLFNDTRADIMAHYINRPHVTLREFVDLILGSFQTLMS
jgi:hypothetical protein